MIRRETPLDPETESLVELIIDCAVTVHRGLGPGYVESIYRNAFCLELQERQIPFACESSVMIMYREKPVGIHRMDLIVADTVIVELKAVKWLEPAHQVQLLSYLKATHLHVGLLMNFGGATLMQGGLRRFVL